MVAMQLGRDYIISINDPEPKVNWLCSSSISATISFVSFSGQADHTAAVGEGAQEGAEGGQAPRQDGPQEHCPLLQHLDGDTAGR